MNRNNIYSQQGAAIIVALFVMALVAAIAVAMMFRLNIEVHRSELILNSDDATLYAQGSIDWAIEQLKTDLINKRPNQVIDLIPITSKSNTIDGYTITSTIEDMQNKINLNDLQDGKRQEHFDRLLHLLLPKVSFENISKLNQAIVDWTTPSSRDSALEAYYQKQIFPYQAPHRPMASVSELRLVRGVSADVYQLLLPYVTALPEGTKLNVNNAEWEVIYSLAPAMSADAAKTIALRCKQMPFASNADFSNYDVVKNNHLDENDIGIASDYFLVKTNVKVGQQQIMLYTMLQRSTQDNNVDVKIVWQSRAY